MASALPFVGEADQLLREAHEATYRFPTDFRGFVATATLIRAGAVPASGTVAVWRPSHIEFDLEGDDESLEWAAKELSSLVGHCWPQPSMAGTGRLSKILLPDDGDPLGRLVELDDPHSSSFRVADGHIGEVNRQMGPVRCSIVVQERRAAPGGRSVPAAFCVAARRVSAASAEGLYTRELRFDDHRLLNGTWA